MGCLATVIIPTHDHGPTIRHALTSALRQSVADIEIFVIGDGVAPRDKELLIELAAADPRVRFIDKPKHESRGEPYRHEALEDASGEIVCYLCDRDVWLPCHVERMLKQLQSADFTHSLSMHVLGDGAYRFFPTDLALPEHRRFMRDVANRVAFSCAAHTMKAYRSLPYGWRTTPPGVPTDWYMFKQFLAMGECRASSGVFPSAITFPSPPRYSWSRERRIAELESWATALADETKRTAIVLDILQQAVRSRDAASAELMRALDDVMKLLKDIRTSPLWACRDALKRVPGLARFVRSTVGRLSRGSARLE